MRNIKGKPVFPVIAIIITACVFLSGIYIPSALADEPSKATRSWTNGEFTNYNTSDGLSNKFISALQIDAVHKSVYVGTNGGLTIFDITNNSFTTKSTDDGLSSNSIWALELDTTNQILYIGTHGGGLNIYNITADTFTNITFWVPYPVNITTIDTDINALELDSQNKKLYIGTSYRNLIIYNITNGTYYVKHIGDWYYLLEWYEIYQLGLDSDDNKLYLDAGDHFYVYHVLNDTLEGTTGLSPFLIDGENNRMYGEGMIYPGWVPGLVVYDTTDMTRVDEKTVADGIPPCDASLFSTFALDSTNNLLYIGMVDEGLSIYDMSAEQFTNKNESDGLISDEVRSLALDVDDEKLYIGTNEGLSVYDFSYVPTPPTISHIPVTMSEVNTTIPINATIIDDIGVTAARLFYKGINEVNFTNTNMTLSSGTLKNGTWIGEIPPQNVSGQVSYYIEANDGVITVTNPLNIIAPYIIEISQSTNTTNTGDDGDIGGFLSDFDNYGLILLLLLTIALIFLAVIISITRKKRKVVENREGRGVDEEKSNTRD